MKQPILLLLFALVSTLPARADFECVDGKLIAMNRAAGHETSGGRESPMMAVSVQFGSTGTGIDARSYDALLEIIGGKLRSGSLVKVTNRKYGREGESTLCLEFGGTYQSAGAMEEIKTAICEAHDPLKAMPKVDLQWKCDEAALDPK